MIPIRVLKMPQQKVIDLDSCRICMTNKKPLCPLFKYQAAGNFVQMLTAIANIKVETSDGLPDKLCYTCCTALEKAYLFKVTAENTDRKLRKALENANCAPAKKISFNSFNEVKTEIAPFVLKPEPQWELEDDTKNLVEDMVSNDGVNNIKVVKVESKTDKYQEIADDITNAIDSNSESDTECVFDDKDDIDDEDYVPAKEKHNDRLKNPIFIERKAFKESKKVIRKVQPKLIQSKILKKITRNPDDFNRNYKIVKVQKPSNLRLPLHSLVRKRLNGPIILRVKNSGLSYKGPTRIIRSDRAVHVTPKAQPAPRTKEKMVCPVCGILTFTLNAHITIHEEKKQYPCTQCSHKFSQKSSLQTHMKLHSGIKDYVCETCKAAFHTKKSLVRHMMIHNEERPHACNLCTKKFVTNQSLRIHLRTHTGEKPFNCTYCNKSFNQKHHLQNHIITHTGNRPFTCEICNVAFSYKVNLNNHVWKVHGVNIKFKSIHNITEKVLSREADLDNVASQSMQLVDPPAPAAHETIEMPDSLKDF